MSQLHRSSPLLARLQTALWAATLLALSGLPAQAADPPRASSAEARELGKDLDAILADKRLKDVKIGVHVLDLGTGETLYEKNADALLNPASNAKIITTAAVLDRFSPSHTFTTELWGQKTSGGVIEGEVAISGDGDPMLKWSHLLELAERTRRKGIREIQGDLVVVDTAFDDQFLPPAFDQKNEEAPYRASVGAVAAEFGAMTVIIRPTEAGKKPVISFDPPCDYAIVDNQAVSVGSGKEAARDPLSVRLVADGQRTRVIIRGKTHKGATLRKRVDFPTVYTGYLMKEALAALGITVKGKVRRGPMPQDVRLLARHSSYTLTYSVLAMQKWSNNFMAEMLFKTMDLGSAPATWGGAQRRVVEFLEKAGIKAGSCKITNGSGLYDANAVSARQFTSLLAYMQTRPDILPDFEASFAIAAGDGTLGRRMKDTPAARVLRAKTGTLNKVITLTGFLQLDGGRKIAFSILFNNAAGGAWGYRNIQDRIGARLARLGTPEAPPPAPK